MINLACLSKHQLILLKEIVKRDHPTLDDGVIDELISFVDWNAKKRCEERNIMTPPPEKIIKEVYFIKATKFANCLNARL